MRTIEVTNLVHYFDGQPVIKDLSFVVNRGEIFGLLGPNGAGKSTLIKILVTLLKHTTGAVKLNGLDLRTGSATVRQAIGVVFQDSSLDERLTGYENLYFHAQLYHVPKREIKTRIQRLLELVGLSERQHDLVMKYSGGMKRRLEIVRGILHHPQILFLDEPTIGLDPQTRKLIWAYIAEIRLQQNLTVFLTTHYLEEAEICDQIAIIDQGMIIALDTPARLKQKVGGDVITLRTENNIAVRDIIREGFRIEVLIEANELRIQVANCATFLPQLFETLGSKIIAVDIKKPTLEDVFIKLTGREIREAENNEAEKLRNVVNSRGLK